MSRSPHRMRGSQLLVIFALAFLPTACAPRVDDRPVHPEDYGRPVRLACVGDSITECADCWPTHLADWLGEAWQVKNFGLGGATMLESGDHPYARLKLSEVLAFEPDVVVIVMGTNDSKPRHWYYRKEFARDYRRLVKSFQALPTRPRIWIALPPPAFPGQWGIDNGRLHEMQPVLRRVARLCGVPIIDLYSPLTGHPDWFPDQVHPTSPGSTLIAQEIYLALTGRSVEQ